MGLVAVGTGIGLGVIIDLGLTVREPAAGIGLEEAY